MKRALFIVVTYSIYTIICEENKTEHLKIQELQKATITNESVTPRHNFTIKTEDAMKIIERSNHTLAEEKGDLLKLLKWLIDTHNVTELYIENFQSKDVHESSETKDSGNSTNIGRKRHDHETGFESLKYAIVSHWSFTTRIPHTLIEAEQYRQSVQAGLKYREKFLSKYKIDLETPIPRQ